MTFLKGSLTLHSRKSGKGEEAKLERSNVCSSILVLFSCVHTCVKCAQHDLYQISWNFYMTNRNKHIILYIVLCIIETRHSRRRWTLNFAVAVAELPCFSTISSRTPVTRELSSILPVAIHDRRQPRRFAHVPPPETSKRTQAKLIPLVDRPSKPFDASENAPGITSIEY